MEVVRAPRWTVLCKYALVGLIGKRAERLGRQGLVMAVLPHKVL